MSGKWYYSRFGDIAGPLSAQELKEHAREGRFSVDDLVSRDGETQWKSAALVKGLFDAIGEEDREVSPAADERADSRPDRETEHLGSTPDQKRNRTRVLTVVLTVICLSVLVAVMYRAGTDPDTPSPDLASQTAGNGGNNLPTPSDSAQSRSAGAQNQAQTHPASSPGRRYAFLVAVDEYGGTDLSSLRFAESDINGLADALLTCGYQSENVVRMTHSVGARNARFLPMADRIRRELELLIREVGPDDSLLVAFSGHGVQFKDEDESWFCPMDAKLIDRETLVSLSNVYTQLDESCSARTKVILVDACRDDPLAKSSKSAKEIELDPVGVPNNQVVPGSLTVFFSCSGGQRSWEAPALNHGVFLSYVIEAFSHAGDVNRDGELSLAELELHAIENTQKYVRKNLGESQIPERRGNVRGLISIADIPARPKHVTKKKVPVSVVENDPIKRRTDNSLNMPLIWISPGQFTMGSPPDEVGRGNNEDQVFVTLTSGYWMSAIETTQRMWRSIMATSPWEKVPGTPAGLDYPATSMTWDEASEFCTRLTDRERRNQRISKDWQYALPTEAQWEFAARGGSESAWCNGNDPIKASEHGWFKTGTQGQKDVTQLSRIGARKPNSSGFHDMHGNVWEWCADSYQTRMPGGRNPLSQLSGSSRSIRGGAWNSDAAGCRSSIRFGVAPDTRNAAQGFRFALVPTRRPLAPTAPAPAIPATGKEKKPDIATRPIRTRFDNALGMKFVWVPGGEFIMGREKPKKVTLRGYWLGRFEVTQAEWLSARPTPPWRNKYITATGPTIPAVQISYLNARSFCGAFTKLERLAGRTGRGFRLPTEAEWEYACRAGQKGGFGIAPGAGQVEEYAILRFSRRVRSTLYPVGSRKPNHWGLYDMIGNASEWCDTRYTRGGSYTDQTGDAWTTRQYGSTDMHPNIGFRVVMEGD